LRATLHPEFGVFFRGAALLGLLTVVRPVPEKTLIDGSAVPCADSRESTSGVPGVHAYAFNAKKVPAIRKSLFVLDSLDWENGDPAAMRAAGAEYDRKQPGSGFWVKPSGGGSRFTIRPKSLPPLARKK